METNTILWILLGICYLYFGSSTILKVEDTTDYLDDPTDTPVLFYKFMIFLLWWIFLPWLAFWQTDNS